MVIPKAPEENPHSDPLKHVAPDLIPEALERIVLPSFMKVPEKTRMCPSTISFREANYMMFSFPQFYFENITLVQSKSSNVFAFPSVVHSVKIRSKWD